MCSVDIVDVINEEREMEAAGGRFATMRHDNFTTKIEKHPGIDSPKFLGEYKDDKGRMQKCYYLPKREAELMVMSESLKVQTRVYDRLAAIEAGTLTAPQPRRATGSNKSLDSFRQARALEITKNVAGDLCAMFPDLDRSAQQTIYAKLINNVAGADVVPLPAVEQLFSATEIGEKFGVSANAVGRMAIAHGLKIDKYGKSILDKSRSSDKQMTNFHYNAAGVARLGELFGHSGKPAPGGQAQLGFEPPAED